MRTLYYHAGASAAAAGRGLGVLDVRGDDRGRVFAAADPGGGHWRRAARLLRARQRSPISFSHAIFDSGAFSPPCSLRFVAFMASKKYIDPKLTLVPYQAEALRCARHDMFLVFG
jgi:hypothetical protein